MPALNLQDSRDFSSFLQCLDPDNIRNLISSYGHNPLQPKFADNGFFVLMQIISATLDKIDALDLKEHLLIIGRGPEDGDKIFRYLPGAVRHLNRIYYGPLITTREASSNVLFFTGAHGGAGKTSTCLTFMCRFYSEGLPGTCLELNQMNPDLWKQLFLGLANGTEKSVRGSEKWKYCTLVGSSIVAMTRHNMGDVLGSIRRVYWRIEEVIYLLKNEIGLAECTNNLLVDTNLAIPNLVESYPTFKLDDNRQFPNLREANILVIHSVWPGDGIGQYRAQAAEGINRYCEWMRNRQQSFGSNKNIIWVLNPYARIRKHEMQACENQWLTKLQDAPLTNGMDDVTLFQEVLAPISSELGKQEPNEQYQTIARQILNIFNGCRPLNVFVLSSFNDGLKGFPRDVPPREDPNVRVAKLKSIMAPACEDISNQWGDYLGFLKDRGE